MHFYRTTIFIRKCILNPRKSTTIMFFIILMIFLKDVILTRSDHLYGTVIEFVIDATPILFPPTKMIVYSCFDRQEDIINLSKLISKNYLMHDIRNNLKEFQRIDYDNVEREYLYVFNSNCNNTIELLNQANSNEMFTAPTKWIVFPCNDNFVTIKRMFENFQVFPNSDVILFKNQYEILSIYRPSASRAVILEERGNWTRNKGIELTNNLPLCSRRKNLHQTLLKSVLITGVPDTINHLTDYHDLKNDILVKMNYPWVIHLANFMNATIEFQTTSSSGYFNKNNGSWGGLIGRFQRGGIDLGGCTTFMGKDRLNVIDYVQLYTRLNTGFVFRKPHLSTVKNILILPFDHRVWTTINVFVCFLSATLYISTKWEYRLRSKSNTSEPTISDNVLVVIGTITQQGYSYRPVQLSSRFVILILHMIVLNLYAAYSANIVNLFKATTDSIQTLTDLYQSPMKLGIRDSVAVRELVQTFDDPIKKKIYNEKIKAKKKGERSGWMSMDEGVNQLRTGMFAFHSMTGSIYSTIQDKFDEDEKCDFTEIPYLEDTHTLLPIQLRSPYREILRVGALKISESGLRDRDEFKFYAKKPKCLGTTYATVGIMECKFALMVLVYGFVISFFIFLIEILYSRSRLKNRIIYLK